MSAFLNHQLTNVGWDALSTALVGGTLTFFKMQAGSGTIANDAVIPGMTGLVAPVYDIAITSYVIEGDGKITLIGNINSELLDAGFTFKELGVFATIEAPTAGYGGVPSAAGGFQVIANTPEARANPIVPDPPVGTRLMYSYCNSYAASDYIPGKNESTNVVNTVQVTIAIAEAQPVINILPAEGSFAVTNIGPPTVGPGPWSYTNANVAYLKRLVAGGGIVLSENTNTITIGTTTLTHDLDLYVANGNPDIAPDFSTIQNAISYLGGFLIPVTLKARIHVSRGYYSMPGVVGSDTGYQTHTSLVHPQGQQITIQGPQNNTVTATSVSSPTGSAYNWNVTFNGISSTAQFQVNDYCIVNESNRATTGYNANICGFFKVVSKTASSVTLKIPYYYTSFAIGGINNAKLTPISVILTPNTNVGGFYAGPDGVGLFQYIGVVGQNSTKRNWGITIEGNSTLVYCGVEGFNSEYSDSTKNNIEGGFISVYGATMHLIGCAASRCQSGITSAANGGALIERCAASHCNMTGFWFDGGGSVHFMGGFSSTGGNSKDGLTVSSGMTCLFNHSQPNPGLYTQENYGNGIRVDGCSLCEAYNGISIRCDFNYGDDLSVASLSQFYGQTYITGDRSFNIPVGSISSQGGLIT